MKWSQRDTLRFVNLYREHECLWKVKHPRYTNRISRRRAMENMMQRMGLWDLSVEDVRVKLNSLRATFNKEMWKIKNSMKSGCPLENVYEPRMKWFKVWKSISEESKTPPTNIDNDDSSDSNDEEYTESTGFKGSSSTSQDAKASKDHPIGDDTSRVGTPPPLHSQSMKRHDKLRGSDRRLYEISIAIKELLKAYSLLSRRQPVRTEYGSFGRFAASIMNKLPRIQAVLAQDEIQNVLTKYRLQSLENMSSSPSDIRSQSINPEWHSPSLESTHSHLVNPTGPENSERFNNGDEMVLLSQIKTEME